MNNSLCFVLVRAVAVAVVYAVVPVVCGFAVAVAFFVAFPFALDDLLQCAASMTVITASQAATSFRSS